MKKVYIGVGHGGTDPGAVAQGFREKDLALAIATATTAELKRHGAGVMQSRTADANKNTAAKVKECNAYNPDLAVDIHLNAGGGDGCEVYHSYLGGTGKTLAENIVAEMVKKGQNPHGVAVKTKRNADGRDYFGFVRQMNCPSVLVEAAFIDTKDVQIVDTPAEQKATGQAIAHGILKTLGIAIKPNDVPAEEPAGKPSNGSTETAAIDMPILRRGSKDGAVKPLQALLTANGISVGAYGVDGDYGAGTETAVKEWQTKCKIPVTGAVDAVTWKTILGVK